jgi:hypothetical protein
VGREEVVCGSGKGAREGEGGKGNGEISLAHGCGGWVGFCDHQTHC